MDQVPVSSRYSFLGFCLDAGARRLLDAQGEPVALNDRAFDTLTCLVQHSGQTLSKDFLMKAVWPNEVVEENNLNQAILTLRKALGDNSRDPRFIHTVTRRGFCFTAPVEVLEQDVPESPAPSASSARPPFPSLPGYAAVLLLAAGVYLLWPRAGNDSGSVNLSEVLEPLVEASELLPDSIAILPFKVLNTADNSDLFSDGLHAEIISRLAALDDISVIGRESVMHMSQDDVNITSIRDLFKVETVMSGTILFHEDVARINLEIVDTETLMNLWSGSYETATKNLDDIFSVHSDIAINVANALAATLDKQTLQEISQPPTSSYQAYAYYLASRQAFEKQDYKMAWQLGQQAVEMDPAYLEALYNFSHINAVLVGMPLPSLDSTKHLDLALDIADRYIRRAPEKYEGYALRAAALNIAGDQEAVIAEFERMTSMGFNISEMRFNPLLLSLGKFEQAMQALEKRVQLHPLNPYNRGFLMVAYELSGRRQKARELYSIGDELHNRWWGDDVNVVLSMGRNEPLQDIDELLLSDELKQVLKNLDQPELVNAALLRQLRDSVPATHDLVYFAAIAAHTGEPQLALDLMRKALPSSWLNLMWIWLPVFDDMRKEAGFRTLLVDFGVTEYWDKLGWSEVCNRTSEIVNCDWQAYTAL